MVKIVHVFNRGNTTFSIKYDGVSVSIPPLKSVPVEQETAEHGYIQSRFNVDKYTQYGQHQLAIEEYGHDKTPLEGTEEKSFLDHKVIEEVEGRKFGKKEFRNPKEFTQTPEAGSTIAGKP